ncbi:hypothetical protein L9G15_05520 [Shewanella sp. A3A]|nr:hypothetical protein [Shewanella ferrihydritica]
MLPYRLSTPQLINVLQPCRIRILPIAGINDLLLLEATNSAICEVVVSQNEACDRLAINLRLHPCFRMETSSAVAALRATNIVRGVGQGCRVYQALKMSKSACVAQLKQGITLGFYPQGELLAVSMDEPFLNLVVLEQDQYLTTEPSAICHAKAVLNQPFDYTAAPNQLVLELSELLQVNSELTTFAMQTALQQVPSLMQTIDKLQQQLEAKRQWVYRHYCIAMERGNLGQSANGSLGREDARRLALYEMLASDELTQLVNMMVSDESKISLAE